MTPQEIIQDPNFLSLPSGERKKVLSTIDPNFASLPSLEQDKVISSFGTTTPFFPRMPAGIGLGEIDPGIVSETMGVPAELQGQTVTAAPPRGLIPMLTMGGGVVLGGLAGPAGAYYGGVGGAGAGSVLEDKWYGAAGEPTSGTDMAKNALGSMIAAGVGARPMEPSSVPKEWQELAGAAKSGGIPLSLQSITQGQRGNVLEGLANITLAGKYKAEKALSKATDLTMALRGQVLEELAGAPGKAAGKRMIDLKSMGKETMLPKTEAAYLPLKESLAGETIQATNLTGAIESALERIPVNPKSESTRKWLTDILTELKTTGSIPGESLYNFQGVVNRSMSNQYKRESDGIVKAVSQDLTEYSVNKGMADNFSDIYLKARNASRNEKGFDTIYGIMNKASELNKDTGNEFFKVGVFESELNRKKGAIFAQFGPEQGGKILHQMEDLADIFKAVARDAEFLAGKNPTIENIKKVVNFGQTVGVAGLASAETRGITTGILVGNGTGLAITTALTNPTINKSLIDLMRVMSRMKSGLGAVPPVLRGAVPVAIGKNVMGGE